MKKIKYETERLNITLVPVSNPAQIKSFKTLVGENLSPTYFCSHVISGEIADNGTKEAIILKSFGLVEDFFLNDSEKIIETGIWKALEKLHVQVSQEGIETMTINSNREKLNEIFAKLREKSVTSDVFYYNTGESEHIVNKIFKMQGSSLISDCFGGFLITAANNPKSRYNDSDEADESEYSSIKTWHKMIIELLDGIENKILFKMYFNDKENGECLLESHINIYDDLVLINNSTLIKNILKEIELKQIQITESEIEAIIYSAFRLNEI